MPFASPEAQQLTGIRAIIRELNKGIPHELLTFEDEDHSIARPENLKVLYPRLAGFFEKAFG